MEKKNHPSLIVANRPQFNGVRALSHLTQRLIVNKTSK